ncbi:immune inhibitor A [candidate division WOR-3 bacterium]|nr:immune inhibitor A [candidate division WOR-3 bacterium]
MRLVGIVGLVLVLAGGTAAAQHDQLLVRVAARDYQQLYDHIPFKGTTINIAGAVPGESYDLMVYRSELPIVLGCGLAAEVVADDLGTLGAEAGTFGFYCSYDSLVSTMRNLAANYPAICRLDSFGTTHEGRWVIGLKISDNPGVDEDEPEVLFFGQVHAREWAAGQVIRHFCDSLLSNYASNSSFRDLVDGREIWVFPVVNADGFTYDYPSQRSWRKNRQPFGSAIGCDPNRDFNGVCSGNRMGDWGSLVSGSRTTHYPSDETFFGATGAWGKEVGALCDFFKQRTFVACLDLHSYSELVLWPYGHGENTPDNTYYSSFGQQIASRINKLSGGTYTPSRSDQLYPTNGGSDDWFYGWSHYIGGYPCMSFCVELGTSFYQNTSQLSTIQTQAFKGLLYTAQQADDIISSLEGTVPRPFLAPLDSSATGDFTVSWTPVKPEHSHPTKWEVEELCGLTVVEDGFESGTDQWVLQGATRATSQKHAGSYSVFLGSANNISNYLATKDPYPVLPGDSLEYWIWYDLENNYDVVTSEVSLEGKEWIQLHDRYTGNSSGWVRKAYSLEPWAGRSVYIRFRTMTDDNTLRNGAYIDDVWPVPEFASRQVLADNITDTLYEVTGRTPGQYWYRVRGFNAAWNWGDQGPLEDIVVTGTGVAEQPSQPGLRTGLAVGRSVSTGPFELSYTVARPGRASLNVTDINGRVVRTCVSGTVEAGQYSVRWDGSDGQGRRLAAGVYFVRLEADETAVARVVLAD